MMRTLACILFALAPVVPAWAQGPAGELEGRSAPIDFWGDATGRPPARASKRKEIENRLHAAMLWAEPVALPDGRVVPRLPPSPVLALLVERSEEAARAYLRWQRERAEALEEAARLLAKVSEPEVEPKSPEGPPSASDGLHPGQSPLPGSGRYRLFFFLDPGCSACVAAHAAIERFAAGHPEADVVGFATGDADAAAGFRNAVSAAGGSVGYPIVAGAGDLWSRFGVATAPTAILVDIESQEAAALSGAQEFSGLDAAYDRLKSLSAPSPKEGDRR